MLLGLEPRVTRTRTRSQRVCRVCQRWLVSTEFCPPRGGEGRPTPRTPLPPLTLSTRLHRLGRRGRPRRGPEASSRKPRAGSCAPEAAHRSSRAGCHAQHAGSRKRRTGSIVPEAVRRKIAMLSRAGSHAPEETRWQLCNGLGRTSPKNLSEATLLIL